MEKNGLLPYYLILANNTLHFSSLLSFLDACVHIVNNRGEWMIFRLSKFILFLFIEFQSTFSTSYKMLPSLCLLLLYFDLVVSDRPSELHFSHARFLPYSRLSSYLPRLFLYLITERIACINFQELGAF